MKRQHSIEDVSYKTKKININACYEKEVYDYIILTNPDKDKYQSEYPITKKVFYGQQYCLFKWFLCNQIFNSLNATVRTQKILCFLYGALIDISVNVVDDDGLFPCHIKYSIILNKSISMKHIAYLIKNLQEASRIEPIRIYYNPIGYGDFTAIGFDGMDEESNNNKTLTDCLHENSYPLLAKTYDY